MDRLEEFIRKNREELDKYNPPASIRRKLSRELKRRKSMTKRWLSIAAMIIVILGTAVILFKPFRGEYDNLSQTDHQLKETEIYYNQMVKTLYNEAAPLLRKNPEIREELNADLSQLDSICIDLKKDLKDNISNQDVVEALIQNYRIKISILEDMLEVLKEENNNPEKKNHHEL
jgi:hypothetical protein